MSSVKRQEEPDQPSESERRVKAPKRRNVVTRRDVLMLVGVWMAGCAIVTILLGFFYTQSVAQEPQQQAASDSYSRTHDRPGDQSQRRLVLDPREQLVSGNTTGHVDYRV